jgi:hypothetical protein
MRHLSILVLISAILIYPTWCLPKTPPKPPKIDRSLFKSIESCREVSWEYSWSPCITLACLSGHYQDWIPWQKAQKECTIRCQRASHGISCAYGDVFLKAKSGITLDLWCQCSGYSSNSTCTAMQKPMYEVAPLMKKPTKKAVFRACKLWCGHGEPVGYNKEHCEVSTVKDLKPPQPLLNWTCSCGSSA